MSDSASAHAGSNGNAFLTGVGAVVVGVILLIGAFIFLPAFGRATMDILNRMSGTAPVVQQVQPQPQPPQTVVVAPAQIGSLAAPPLEIQSPSGQTFHWQGTEETVDAIPCPPGQIVQGPDGYPRRCRGQR